MPEALCGGWPLLRAASVGRYALPEGGRIGRMTGEGGGADTPPPAFAVFVGYRFVHNP